MAAYLAHRAEKSLGRSGLRLILAAVAHHHRRAGHVWSAGDPVAATVLRGILREQKRPVRPAAAITSAEFRLLLGGCADDLPGLRDRALLLTGLAGVLRRSELVAVDREDLRFGPDGVVLRIRSAKSDQEGDAWEFLQPCTLSGLWRAERVWPEPAGPERPEAFARGVHV